MNDLHSLRSIALTATSPGPDKWTANTALISWFRSDPVAVIDALIAAEQTRRRPGGVSNQALDAALKALPDVELAREVGLRAVTMGEALR